MFTVTQAADKLGITRQRVLQLISAKRLEAKKVGSTWLVMSLKRKKVK